MNKSNGFSLLEISIVLIVLGSLVGLVLSFDAALEKARERNIVKQFSELESAVNNFYSTYRALPGDFADARNTFTSCPSATYSCSGNGNGTLDDNITNNFGFEYLRSLSHLYYAGFSTFEATGVPVGSTLTAGNINLVPNVNVIESPFKGSHVTLASFNGSLNTQNSAVSAVLWSRTSGQYVPAQLPSITPLIAEAIDLKVDDGLGNKGRIRGGETALNLCVNSLTSQYQVTSQNNTCFLQFSILN